MNWSDQPLLRALTLPLFLLAISAVAVNAQGTNVALGGDQPDPDAPVEITSETLNVDRNAGTALFEGDVLVV